LASASLDADHRKDDDGRGFRIGIDIFAAARVASFVGKPDDFTHCNPLAATTFRTCRVGAFRN